MADNTSLKDAVSAATATADKELEGSVQETPEVKEPEVKETPKAEETEDEKAERIVEEKNARELYKGLKDPETRGALIEMIAKQAGYSKIETKQEATEAKKGIQEILTEALGPEFEFLTNKLGPAIEKFVKQTHEDDLKEIREQQAEAAKEKLQEQSQRSLTKLTTSYFGEGEKLPDNVVKGMSEFMDKVPPQPEMSISDYTEYAFYQTVGRLGVSKATQKTKSERTNTNRTDAASRLASDRSSAAVGQPSPKTPTTLNLKQAISDAIEQVNKENN